MFIFAESSVALCGKCWVALSFQCVEFCLSVSSVVSWLIVHAPSSYSVDLDLIFFLLSWKVKVVCVCLFISFFLSFFTVWKQKMESTTKLKNNLTAPSAWSGRRNRPENSVFYVIAFFPLCMCINKENIKKVQQEKGKRICLTGLTYKEK